MARFFKKKEGPYVAPDAPGLRYLMQDPFVESPKVVGLDPDSYHKFVEYRNAVLIMFYNPLKKDCASTAKHFSKAARKSKTPDQAFGAVNCNAYPRLCCQEGVNILPFFKLYAWGRLASEYYYGQFQYDDMKSWLQAVPLHNPRLSNITQPSQAVPPTQGSEYSEGPYSEYSEEGTYYSECKDCVDVEYESPGSIQESFLEQSTDEEGVPTYYAPPTPAQSPGSVGSTPSVKPRTSLYNSPPPKGMTTTPRPTPRS